MKKYQFEFSVWGCVLFFRIMIPNFIWFFVPILHDVLKKESITPFIDKIASIFQIIMIGSIYLLKRKDVQQITIHSKWIVICSTAILFYFICWTAYFFGIVDSFILVSLSVFPCIAFLAYEIDRKNWMVLIPTIVFTVLHMSYSLLNFVI